MAPNNCWELKNCGRTEGGNKVAEMGICPAYPAHGRDCWMVAGTFCGGKVQGTHAQKHATCMACDWYKAVKNS